MRVVRGIGGGRPPRNIGPSQIDAHPGLDPGRVPCSTTRLGRLGSADKSETEGRRRLGGSEPSRNDLSIEEQMHHDVVCRCSCGCIGSIFVLRRGIARLGCWLRLNTPPLETWLAGRLARLSSRCLDNRASLVKCRNYGV